MSSGIKNYLKIFLLLGFLAITAERQGLLEAEKGLRKAKITRKMARTV
jgi:hypothetical protein